MTITTCSNYKIVYDFLAFTFIVQSLSKHLVAEDSISTTDQ